MFIGIITLLTALFISAVSIYYSIVGLMAIFAGAVIPIIIMGIALELGKLSSVIWLHYNWERASLKLKVYLVPAVVFLMILTSMGIFGFLSKSHLDQAVPSGDVQAQVSLFDEKIKTQRDNIESARKALTQLDSAVDQTMARTTDDTGATKSANLRRSQQKERGRLQQDIDTAQKQITVLQEQRAPIASQYRKVEAEVGPLKYIAALIYGDNADQNMLEAAVRWVIIIIVLVFDPLAITLILAATTSIDWSKLDRKKRKQEELEEKKEAARMQVELDETLDELKHHKDAKASEAEILKIVEDTIVLTRAECAAEAEKTRLKGCEECSANLELRLKETQGKIEQKTKEKEIREAEVKEITNLLIKMTNEVNELTSEVNELTSFIGTLEEDVSESLNKKGSMQKDLHSIRTDYDDLLLQKEALEITLDATKDELAILDETVRQMGVLQEILVQKDKELAELTDTLEKTAKLVIATPLPKLPLIELSENELDDINGYLEELAQNQQEDNPQIESVEWFEPAPNIVEEQPPSGTVVYADKLNEETVELPVVVNKPTLPLLPEKHDIVMPEIEAMPDNFPMGGNAGFGVTFPNNPTKGDLYLRVDYMPSKLFKWSGTRWIEVDKTVTDTYAYDKEYVKLLVEKVTTGEYDVDDLSVTEREQIAEYLRNNP